MISDIVVYKITQRTQKMMHIIVYQDYTENTEYIVLQTKIANKVSINTEMKQDSIKAINRLKKFRCYKYFKIQLMYPENKFASIRDFPKFP